MDDQIISPPPHIIVFPSPLQWPVNPIFDLSELLCLSGLDVTFLLIPYTHSLLLRHIHVESRLNPYPNFRLHTMSDGLPPDHSQSNLTDLLNSLETLMKPLFRYLLTSGTLACDDRGPVSCIISDGIMSFLYDVANEIQVPVISALTLSPSCLWFLSNLPNLTGAAKVSDPTIGENNADSIVKRIPGIEGILTGDDLANMCASHDLFHPFPKHLIKQIQQLPRAHGLILNTFKALDGPLLSQIRSINTDCIMWLNSQQPKSVLYVKIENHAQLTRVQTLELWHGLVNSEKGFLWMICWPFSWDERVNSKVVGNTWKVGMHMEERWDRNVIEKRIRDVLESKGELTENANKMKKLGRKSVTKGGSSYATLDDLVNLLSNTTRMQKQ
ncbi:hypothetical protein L1887_09109 [Cichorium endivia]|nr:hypothetical protein L1887_09109 [Cichorium endivia]